MRGAVSSVGFVNRTLANAGMAFIGVSVLGFKYWLNENRTAEMLENHLKPDVGPSLIELKCCGAVLC